RLCRDRGLDVIEIDLIELLRELRDGSVSVITAFHVIEHLDFAVLMTLMREALRVLARGGVLVPETPNPANLVVGAHTFHLDPTHRKPLPPQLMEFVMGYTGFSDVTVRILHPPRIEGTDVPRLDELLAGGYDYAV